MNILLNKNSFYNYTHFFKPGITPFHYFDITEIQSSETEATKETGKGKASSEHS